MQSFKELKTELTEYRDLGDRVLGFGHIHASGRESGLELDSPTGWLFTIRRGKVTKAEGFLSRADALDRTSRGRRGRVPVPSGKAQYSAATFWSLRAAAVV
jgi:ketosteroid isomerase-like protein